MAKILLIVSGGIAAYKACEFIRLARREGHSVTPVLTTGGAAFITPLTLAALAESPVYQDLFSLNDESEMGHIRLSRTHDIIVVAPASASLISRMARGSAEDLAAAILLASDKPVLIAPAMNPMMWANPEVINNIEHLGARGVHQIGPDTGDMACGETGAGRLAEPAEILAEAERILGYSKTLRGLHAIVTSGPTREPLDPVRYISNYSSGKQGHAIAAALHKAGARVTLITGPVNLPSPDNINVISVVTAAEMMAAVEASLPADIFVGAAAVADWTAKPLINKYKKEKSQTWTLDLEPTIDILARISQMPKPNRPRLCIGFALESENVADNAAHKYAQKQCDALLVNSVTQNYSPFGADNNYLGWLNEAGLEDWGLASKEAHARNLLNKINTFFK